MVHTFKFTQLHGNTLVKGGFCQRMSSAEEITIVSSRVGDVGFESQPNAAEGRSHPIYRPQQVPLRLAQAQGGKVSRGSKDPAR